MKRCLESFMAGTICSDHAGHEGPHSAKCLTCDGDWMLGTCECVSYCEYCEEETEEIRKIEDQDGTCTVCLECYEGHKSESEPSDAEMSEIYKSLGVA